MPLAEEGIPKATERVEASFVEFEFFEQRMEFPF